MRIISSNKGAIIFQSIKNLFVTESMDLTEVYKTLLPRIKPYFKKAIFLEKTTTPTKSSIGGVPQVKHESFTYPYVDGRPLTFIAQIDLAEINQNYYIDYLPNEGILLFFYDVEIQVWGFDPKDRPHFKVIYLKEEAYKQQDEPHPKNIDKKILLKQSHIKANFIDVPMPVDAEEIDKLELNDLEYDAYCDYASNQIFNHEPLHQLGGYPTPEQGNNMELEAQLVTHGIYCGDPSNYASEEAKLLEKDENNWKLLLQIDSDKELALMWGDEGKLYFWVEKSEAKSGNFDNSWLILQCG